MEDNLVTRLKAAKHQHAACCYTPEGIMCICLANQHNASIDAAIAELEKQPAEQTLMELNAIYFWNHEPARRLRYLGHNQAGGGPENGFWHQFSLEHDTEKKVWCEVLTKDLPMISRAEEAAKPSTANVPFAWVCRNGKDGWDFLGDSKDPNGKLLGTWEPLFLGPSTAKEVPADVLAVLDELGKLSRWEIWSGYAESEMIQSSNGEFVMFEDIRTLTATLRSLLGGEV